MKILPFTSSALVSMGVELEYQIVSPYTQNLVARAKDLIRNIQTGPYSELIKPEVTQSMIEINSSVHTSPKTMQKELQSIKTYLMEEARELGVCICGGGTHPYQKWSLRKIFPTPRYKNLSRQYQYLSKRATVFGLHIHVGCTNGDEAIYLTHALARYVPQLIALSASSPFYEGIDSGFNSSRSNIFSAFPSSGTMPYLANWKEFSVYFNKMHDLKLVKNMRDFYWDLRPKPELGTVEIRVCDVPLAFDKVIQLVAYVQSLALFLLKERPLLLSPDLYYLYNFNRFQAARYGFEGDFIDPSSLVHRSIAADLMITMNNIESYARQLKNTAYLLQLKEAVIKKRNDASLLRKLLPKVGSLHNLVKEQCVIWGSN